MLPCNRLCIDPGDGSPRIEYRVADDRVECRTLERSGETNEPDENRWKPLTSEQLSSHVMSGTVVAHWLQRRMGFHRLLRACNQDPSFANEIPDRSRPRAA